MDLGFWRLGFRHHFFSSSYFSILNFSEFNFLSLFFCYSYLKNFIYYVGRKTIPINIFSLSFPMILMFIFLYSFTFQIKEQKNMIRNIAFFGEPINYHYKTMQYHSKQTCEKTFLVHSQKLFQRFSYTSLLKRRLLQYLIQYNFFSKNSLVWCPLIFGVHSK